MNCAAGSVASGITRSKGRVRIETRASARASSSASGITRSKGRVRIETAMGRAMASVSWRITRSKGRVRIETDFLELDQPIENVSPARKGGCGLKLMSGQVIRRRVVYHPLERAGAD